MKELSILESKVKCCFNSSAQATGCSIQIRESRLPYLDVRQNESLAEAFGKNFDALGVQYEDVGDVNASTDVGNVSYMVPSLHPNYAIGSGELNQHS